MRTKSGTFTTEYGNDNVTKTVDAVKNMAKKTVSAVKSTVKSVVTNVAGKVSTAAKAVTQTVKTVVNTAKTVAGIARTDGLKNALSGLPTSAKATAWQGKVIQAAAKAAIQADNARTAQELAETKAEARQIVADWAGGVYEEFSPRNQKIIDDTVEKVRELLANGASPAEIKRVIRGACTEVAKNVGETVRKDLEKELITAAKNEKNLDVSVETPVSQFKWFDDINLSIGALNIAKIEHTTIAGQNVNKMASSVFDANHAIVISPTGLEKGYSYYIGDFSASATRGLNSVAYKLGYKNNSYGISQGLDVDNLWQSFDYTISQNDGTYVTQSVKISLNNGVVALGALTALVGPATAAAASPAIAPPLLG